MKRFSEQLKKQSTAIKLRSDERADLRERLVTYMEYHPLPAELRTTKKAPATKTLVSESFTTITVNWSLVRGFVGSFAVVALVVLPMLAERSAPGDVLYPIKVELNEELRSTLALTPEKRIEWETTRLERRIAEARILASEGKLSDEVEAEVAAAVKEQSQKTKGEIAKLRSTDETEAAFAEIALASMLEVQNELLEQTIDSTERTSVTVDGDTEPTPGTGLALTVATEISTALSDAPARLTTDQLLAKIEEETTRAQELYNSVEAYATSEEESAIGRRLADIDRRVQVAQALLEPTVVEAPSTEAPQSDVEAETTDDADTEAEATSTAVTDVDATTTAATTEPIDVPTTTTPDTVENETEEAPADSQTESVTDTPVVSDAARAEAKEILQSVLKDLRKLISFMSDIDARESVDVETIVPVVPTDEELAVEVGSRLEVVEAGYAEITTAIETQDITEKAAVGLDTLESEMSEVEAALNAPDYLSAKEAVAGAEAMLTDLRAMIFVNRETAPTTTDTVDTAQTIEDVSVNQSNTTTDEVMAIDDTDGEIKATTTPPGGEVAAPESV